MKIKFNNRLEAITWIANYVEDEGQFELLREQLTFNEFYSGKLYLLFDKKEKEAEIVMLRAKH